MAEDPLMDYRLFIKVIDETDCYTEELFEVLHQAKEEEFIRFIQNRESDQGNRPNLNCNDGYYTYLQYACNYGLKEVAKYLIVSGADPLAVADEDEFPPLYLASNSDNHDIAEYIILKNPGQLFLIDVGYNILHTLVDSEDESDSKLRFLKFIIKKIHLAYDSGDVKEALYLLDEESICGRTPLDMAIENGSGKKIAVLFENGVDMFSKNKRGECKFLKIAPNILEKYLDRKVREDSIEEANFMQFDYSSLLPSECYITDNTSEETSRLVYLSQLPDFCHLVQHPVISSFIHLKWQKVQWLFYIHLLIYMIFFCSIALKIVVIILTGQGVSQCLMSPMDYICQRDSWIDISLIVTSLLIMSGITILKRELTLFLTFVRPFTDRSMYRKVSFPCYSIFVLALTFIFHFTVRVSNTEISLLFHILSNATKTKFVESALIISVFLFICLVSLYLLYGLSISGTQVAIDEAERFGLISKLQFIFYVERTAQRFGMISRFKVLPRRFFNGQLKVSGDNLAPSVLKTARQIKEFTYRPY